MEVESRCCSMCEELADARSKVKEGNYKINNFDTVKKYVSYSSGKPLGSDVCV